MVATELLNELVISGSMAAARLVLFVAQMIEEVNKVVIYQVSSIWWQLGANSAHNLLRTEVGLIRMKTC